METSANEDKHSYKMLHADSKGIADSSSESAHDEDSQRTEDSLGKGFVAKTNELHWETSFGTLEEMEKKLSQGHDANRPDTRGRTAYHRAAYYGDVSKLKLLEKYGADMTCTDNYERTALHIAAKQNRAEALEHLIEKGADVTAKDNYGRQAHHLAALKGATETLKILLSNSKVDINALDNYDHTAYYLAKYYEKNGEEDNRNKMSEAVALLFEKGADRDAGVWDDINKEPV